MTPKEQIFVAEYLSCLNATEAARRAGYKQPHVQGTQVKARLADTITELLRQNIPSPEAVVSRISDMAMADVTEYLNRDGSLDLERMKEDGRGYLLKKYKHTKQTSRRKDSEYESETWETELYPADGALDKLMRYHSMYNDKSDFPGGQPKRVIIEYGDDNT